MLAALRQNGMLCSPDSLGTFYIWADISQLPAPMNHSTAFFREALKHKVITVPGYQFDIRPEHKKKAVEYNHYVRFSFGPDQETITQGLERIRAFIQAHT